LKKLQISLHPPWRRLAATPQEEKEESFIEGPQKNSPPFEKTSYKDV